MSTILKQLLDRLDRARISSYQRRVINEEMALTRAVANVARASSGVRHYI